ncbi:unnamed protein product [Acanthoscelides obtectus]|uniref:Uncharacterized protein n=1 Tax=Acanthoscelides obtectus TaxID=200917 RepID=A0A9P0P0R5_ACAOB|nr:unnamed protein product [Acanthoscelides obtectus]CAK1647970.1 hypothetical protein AOBTE_LOCUS15480 [Acanthoscelides obtectus]
MIAWDFTNVKCFFSCLRYGCDSCAPVHRGTCNRRRRPGHGTDNPRDWASYVFNGHDTHVTHRICDGSHESYRGCSCWNCWTGCQHVWISRQSRRNV